MPNCKKTDARQGATRSLASLIPSLTRKAVGKRGFTDARILNDWDRIVGPDLARHAHPDRISFPRGRREGGTLHIRATGPMATELQHLEPVLVNRINAHFGYGAIAAIRILQVPPVRTPAAPAQRLHTVESLPPADPAELSNLKTKLEAVDDPALREILMGLGESILRQDAAKQRKQ